MTELLSYPLTELKNGGHHPSTLFQCRFARWVPTFIGMSGVMLGGCDPSIENELITHTVTNSKPEVERVAEDKQEYSVVAQALPKDIGLKLGMSSGEAKRVLDEQGLRSFDMVDGYRYSGKCAGSSEILTYFKYDLVEDKKLKILFETDFRSKSINGDCKKVLHYISPIKISEKYNAKNN